MNSIDTPVASRPKERRAPQLLSLSERLAALEGQVEIDRRSVVKRVGAWGGLVALVISLITGSFTIYEKFVANPAARRDALVSEMQTIVARFSSINSKLVELQLEGDLRKLQALSQNANTEKFVLLDRADTIIRSLGDDFGVGHYIQLAYEHLNFGQSKMAEHYAKRAFTSARNPLLKAEAVRYRGRALFLDGEIQNKILAREAFREAIVLADRIPGFLSTQVLGSIYADAIGSELFFGDCDMVPALVNEMNGKFVERQAPLGVAQAILIQIRSIASQQDRCRAPI